MLLFRSLAMFTLAAASFARAQQPASQTDGPPAAYSPAIAYDEARQRLVVFGGYFRGTYPGDTWEWDGTKWTRVAQSGPPGRNWPRMVYDASRGKVVMFGGDTRDGALGDTWEWDGRTWTQLAGPGPAPRSVHGMIYDSDRKRTVVFGGRAGNEYRTDTWELASDGWKKVADSGPPPRMIFGMAYDAKQKRTVVIGGNRALGQPVEGDILSDVWAWDGTRWQQQSGSPVPRDHLAATYDPMREAVMIVGGATSQGPVADAWTWQGGGNWQSLPIGELGARAGHNMVTDARNRRVLLYGGFATSTPSRELWEYTAAGWRRLW